MFEEARNSEKADRSMEFRWANKIPSLKMIGQVSHDPLGLSSDVRKVPHLVRQATITGVHADLNPLCIEYQ